jgi:hypothetical protein
MSDSGVRSSSPWLAFIGLLPVVLMVPILILDVLWTTWTLVRTVTDRRSHPDPGR